MSTETKFTSKDFEVSVLKVSANQPTSSAVIIMPPTGGTNFLDKRYAWALCKKGIDAYILSRWTDDDEVQYDLDIHQRFYDRAQKAISLATENIEARFIGILGSSVGGIHASMAMTHIDKLNAAFVIAAGAPVASVIAHSDQGVLVDAKERRLKMFGFKSDEDYETALKAAIKWDQLSVKNRSSKTLGMINLEKDETVPTKYQRELEAAWKPETKYSFNCGHTGGIIWSWLFYSDNVTNFFVKASKSVEP